MKTYHKLISLVLILSVSMLWSCKEDVEPDLAPYDVLSDYLVQSGKDLPNILSSWIVPPPASVEEVPGFLDNYYVMDIRDAANFDAAHIQGSVNSSLANIVADAAQSGGKQILVVCYTGQTAGHAVVALRLSGYDDAVVLKWGISGWNSEYAGSWENNIGDAAAASSNWIDAPGEITPNGAYGKPGLSSSAGTPQDILAQRVSALTSGGLRGVTNESVLNAPDNYFINNYWAMEDIEHYGHIKGAVRVNPLSIADGSIGNLDPEATVVTYCWTGQTSSMITAYLYVLGYNAQSLKFGANGMIYSNLESHKFATPTVDLPLEGTGIVSKTNFEILSEYLVANNMDLDHVLKSAEGNKFVFAPTNASDVDKFHIIDIRSETDFNAGRIAGSFNVAATNILDEAAKSGNKPILVVCYTGQTACYYTSLLRLYGYHEAQALKWGMSGWHSNFDKWTGNCKSEATSHANWNQNAAPANQEFDYPVINSSEITGEELLKERVEAVIAEGFQTASGSNVLASPDNYHINNYFSEEHYTGFGHIAGAYRINPILIADANTLNPDKPVVTYCYTGQTSAVITAFFRVLGYDAKSLTFGVNGLTHDNAFWSAGSVSNHWGDNASPKDFSYDMN